MPLRRRITLVAATTVACAVAIAILISYFAVRHQLLGQIDTELKVQATAIQVNPHQLGSVMFSSIPASDGGPAQYWQLVEADGTVPPGLSVIRFPSADTATAAAATRLMRLRNAIFSARQSRRT